MNQTFHFGEVVKVITPGGTDEEAEAPTTEGVEGVEETEEEEEVMLEDKAQAVQSKGATPVRAAIHNQAPKQ